MRLNDLPDDVLLLIFEKLGMQTKVKRFSIMKDFDPFCVKQKYQRNFTDPSFEFSADDKQIHKLSNVCKRWSNLINAHHIYYKANFGNLRNKKNFEHWMKCTKKFQSVVFSIRKNLLELRIDRIRKFMKIQTKLCEGELFFRQDVDSLTGAEFKSILDNFKGFRALYIGGNKAEVKDIRKSEEFSTDFSKMLSLGVDGEKELLINLSHLMQLPVLQNLNLVCTDNKFKHNEAEDVLSFVNRSCSDNLNRVTLKDLHFNPHFEWSRDKFSFYLINGNNVHVNEFLTTSRLTNLETIDIGYDDDEFNNTALTKRICQESINLEKLEIDVKILKSLDPQMRINTVKELFVKELFHCIAPGSIDPFLEIFPNARISLNVEYGVPEELRQYLRNLS